VVVDGSRASFSCFTNSADKLCWGLNGVDGLLCNDVTGCRPRYSNESSTDNNHWRHSLRINSRNASDSGRYWCAECLQLNTKKLADLTVLGKSVLAMLRDFYLSESWWTMNTLIGLQYKKYFKL